MLNKIINYEKATMMILKSSLYSDAENTVDITNWWKQNSTNILYTDGKMLQPTLFIFIKSIHRYLQNPLIFNLFNQFIMRNVH